MKTNRPGRECGNAWTGGCGDRPRHGLCRQSCHPPQSVPFNAHRTFQLGRHKRTALVAGAAGFIGYHIARRLLDEGWRLFGLDSHSDYYDPAQKAARESRLNPDPAYTAIRGKVEQVGLLRDLFARERPAVVIHLAAQAGARYSIDNPSAYAEANLMGTFELLEAARTFPPDHLLLASASSVYGANTDMPYRETDRTNAHLFGLPITMFRFFAVYGPRGRRDMAPYLFTSATLDGRPIRVFNHGDMRRDFTHVSDLVRAIRLLIDAVPQRPTGKVPQGDSLSPVAPYRLVNIGNGSPVLLMDFIAAIEDATGRKAILDIQPMQPGDVPAAWADNALLHSLTGYRPQTSLA